MLSYKYWLETRWRVGAVTLGLFATLTFISVLSLQEELPNRKEILEGWFSLSLACLYLLAIVLAPGGLVTETSQGTVAFTLSLPVSRRRLLIIRAATGLIELLGVTAFSTISLLIFSALTHHPLPIIQVILQAALVISGVAAIYGLSFLFSAIFIDPLKPVVTMIGLFFLALSLVGCWIHYAPSNYEHFGPSFGHALNQLTGASFWLTQQIPWAGLTTNLALSLGFVRLAVAIAERRDF